MKAKKNLQSGSMELILINFLLWRAFQQKLCRQDFRDVNHLKRLLLQC